MIAHVIETTVTEQWPAEPWVVDRADGVSLFQEGETEPCLMVADPNGEMSDAESRSIAKRAAACVNACTGLTYDQLENLPELLTVVTQAARAVEAYDALDPSLLDARLTRLMELARRVVPEDFTVSVEGICRVCGCTEDNACMGDDGPCGWAPNSGRTLCTECEADGHG